LTGAHADAQFENIKKDYYKVVEDSEEKVQLSNQVYELVDRYLRRLDTELLKFKCELEADNQGITELLEKRSLELDGSSSVINQKENRYFGSISQNRGSAADRYRHKVEKRRDSGTTSQLGAPVEKRQAITSGLTTPTLRPATPNLTQVLQSNSSSVAYTGNATIIAQAAAQAIEKTQQMQQGRRTASLKASYEAIHGSGMNTHELLMGRDLNSSASHALQSMDRDVSFASTASGSIPKRYKKKVTTLTNIGAAQSPQTSGNLIHQLQTHSNDSDEMPSTYINKDGMVVEQTADGEWTYDPNEPRYCICNQVSYGEMVACDNSEVSDNEAIMQHSIVLTIIILYSVHSNGSIIPVLALQPRPKASGIVRCKFDVNEVFYKFLKSFSFLFSFTGAAKTAKRRMLKRFETFSNPNVCFVNVFLVNCEICLVLKTFLS
jgi:inhibitor of growth protein 3